VRTKVTLVLIFLNVALFFYIFKFERRWRSEEIIRGAQTRVLGAEAADIRTLKIVNSAPGAVPISLERRGESWWLTEPLVWPANVEAVKRITTDLQLLDSVTSFNVAQLSNNSMSLADYGLNQPKLAVTFASGSASAITLRLGDTTNVGNRLYVLSPDGERIHVVARGLADSLALGLDKLRADTLFTIPVFEATGLNVQNSAVRIRIRREANQWLFDTIINNARASKTAIDLAISGLNALKVKSFNPTPAPASLPSTATKLRVALEGNNRRETLLLGDPVPVSTAPGQAPAVGETEYYAQLEGRDAVFTVSIRNDLLETLRNAQVNLREKHLLDFDARAVTAISITAPNQPSLALQRIDAGANATEATWQIVQRGETASGPQTRPADRAVVQRLLEQLSLLSAKEAGGFVSDAPQNTDLEKWGFNRPEREIALTIAAPVRSPNAATPTAPASTNILLQLGTDAAGAVYARLDPLANPNGSIYAVDLDFRRELPVAPRDWRERTFPALPQTARVTALTLTSTAAGATPLYSRTLAPNETLASALDTEPAARKAALETLFAFVRAPRARRFPQDAFSERVTMAGEDRPWSIKLEATVSLPGGTGEQTSTKTFLFTERVGGNQQLAGSREFDAVFEVEMPVIEALWTFTYGPRDPGVPGEPKK
jgi:hypothetical protein